MCLSILRSANLDILLRHQGQKAGFLMKHHQHSPKPPDQHHQMFQVLNPLERFLETPHPNDNILRSLHNAVSDLAMSVSRHLQSYPL
nr:MAG: hypothetical protein [Bacteriophage sp.]